MEGAPHQVLSMYLRTYFSSICGRWAARRATAAQNGVFLRKEVSYMYVCKRWGEEAARGKA